MHHWPAGPAVPARRRRRIARRTSILALTVAAAIALAAPAQNAWSTPGKVKDKEKTQKPAIKASGKRIR